MSKVSDSWSLLETRASSSEQRHFKVKDANPILLQNYLPSLSLSLYLMADMDSAW